MRLVHLHVRNFRGIKRLDWAVGGTSACLVGPGNATKTTILDCLELVLSPRWNVALNDSDFHGADHNEPIRIEATIIGLPEELLLENRFGLRLRGWGADGLHDEPSASTESALTIRFAADASLEPTWEVVTDRHSEGKRISAGDRERLGASRVGSSTERHLTWGQGSSLTRLLDREEGESTKAVLAKATRAARDAFDPGSLASLNKAAKLAEKAGETLSVAAESGFAPHLDARAISVGNSGLTLHDGQVPMRLAGLGNRRLLALALQLEQANEGGLTLIDEIEHGLEPHRVRQVLRAILLANRQTILSTHSSVAVAEVHPGHLHLVRSDGGITTVTGVPTELRQYVKSNPESFLARSVVVCEGPTEIGVCRFLDSYWAEHEDQGSFGLQGVALANGSGSECASRARAFAKLGYRVALFIDSDDAKLAPEVEEAREEGVCVFQWEDTVSIEERLAFDLPRQGLIEMVNLGIARSSDQAVADAVSSRMGEGAPRLGLDPAGWLQSASSEDQLRQAIGTTANKKKWFKRVDLAEELMEHVFRDSAADLAETDFGRKTEQLRVWVASG